VVLKADGLRNSDTRNMVKGNTYEITLRERKWRWMFENDMGGDLRKEERGEILRKKETMEWKADCQVNLKAT
jgi:hypothetical protein